MKTYYRRSLIVEFELNEELHAKFANGSRKIKFYELSINATINRASALAEMDIEIHGLSRDVMELLTDYKLAAPMKSQFGVPMGNKKNHIRLTIPALQRIEGIETGEPLYDEPPEHVVFSGSIVSAGADFNTAPDVVMKMHCNEIFEDQNQEITPVTFGGSFYVKTIIDYLFDSVNKRLPTYSTTAAEEVVLTNHSVRGSFIDALKSVCLAADLSFTVNNDQYVIYKKGEPMPKYQAIPINESTGLIGYPVMNEDGVEIRVLYTQDIKVTDVVNLTAVEQPFLSGEYEVCNVALNLCSEIPSAEWTMILRAQYFAYKPNPQDEKQKEFTPTRKQGERLPDGTVYVAPISAYKLKGKK